MNPEATDIVTRNRANSKRSTGPTTPKGKATSSRNSTKHGILSNSLVVAGENAEQVGALVASVEQDLALTGAIGQEISRSLVAGFQKEKRLDNFERSLVEAAQQEAQDLESYEETETIHKLQQLLGDTRHLHQMLSGAEFKMKELLPHQAAEFLNGIDLEIKACPTTKKGQHPALDLINDLDTEIRRQRRDGGDLRIVKAGLAKVAKLHMDYLLERMVKLSKQRDEKISRAKKLAAIPSEKDLKRLERYQRLIHSSILNKLEMAEKLRGLLQPANQPSGFVLSRDFNTESSVKAAQSLEEGHD